MLTIFSNNYKLNFNDILALKFKEIIDQVLRIKFMHRMLKILHQNSSS